MARETIRHLRRTGVAWRLAAAACVCWAGGLAFIPAATAKRDRERSTVTTPAASPPSAQEPARQQSAGTTPAAPPESRPADPQHPPARGEGAGGKRSKHGGRSQQGSATAPASPSAGADGAEPQPEAGSTQETTAGEGQASPQPAARKTGHKESHKERRKETHKEGSGEGGKEKKGKGKSTQPETPSGGAPEAPRLDPPAPTLTSPLPASTPVASTASVAGAGTPAQATPAPAVGLTPPAAPVRRSHAPRRRSRARAHTHARRGATSAPARVAAAASDARPVSPASPGRSGRTPRRVSHHTTAKGRASPIVRTITRIVDVVPTAVRILIAGLLALALALAVRSRVAALRARRLARQRGELLAYVGLLQAALLPIAPARLGPVGTSVAYQPAAGPGAGGDFYDVFALEDGQLAVIVGDVSGHGRQALPHTALVRFTLRAYLEAGLSPRDALQTAGAVLERQLGGLFATVVIATYQPRERVLVYASAGHPPPIVLGAQPGARPLPPLTICTSPPIGVGMRTGTRQTVVSIPGRARVCFHTDGVTEARVGRELFGSARLADTLTELGPQASASVLLELVAQRADSRPDDMAACLLSIEGEDDAPTVLVEELELDREEASSVRTEHFLRACGVARGEVADVIHSARVAAGRAGTIVLQVRRSDGPAEVALRREHLSYLHARRDEVEVAR
jgi:serine phosphatase RsbU (regulator of sigma subunit)